MKIGSRHFLGPCPSESRLWMSLWYGLCQSTCRPSLCLQNSLAHLLNNHAQGSQCQGQCEGIYTVSPSQVLMKGDAADGRSMAFEPHPDAATITVQRAWR
jgi:hypothetical protein